MKGTGADSGTLSLALHGATGFLEANQAAFLAFARTYLADLLSPSEAAGPTMGHSNADVRARLHWNAAPPAVWQSAETRRWGRRIYQRGDHLLVDEFLALPGLKLELFWAGETLVVEAYYRPTSLLEKMALLGQGRERLFSALVYYLTYFPLLHYLEQIRGWHPLHAAAVAVPGGGYLLAGLPGSGKTTLALHALTDPRAQLLSDNLILYNHERVFACPEAIHLSTDSQGLLPQPTLDRLMDSGREVSHARQDYRLLSEARAWEARPQALFLVHLASEGSAQALPPKQAAERLLAFDRLAKEMNAYDEFAAALELIALRPGQFARRQSDLQSLTASLACYELGLARGSELNGTADFIQQVLEAGRPAAEPSASKATAGATAQETVRA